MLETHRVAYGRMHEDICTTHTSIRRPHTHAALGRFSGAGHGMAWHAWRGLLCECECMLGCACRRHPATSLSVACGVVPVRCCGDVHGDATIGLLQVRAADMMVRDVRREHVRRGGEIACGAGSVWLEGAL